MRGVLLALLIAASCGGGAAPASLRVENGRDVVLEADRALRGLQLDLTWDPGLAVTSIAAGPDAERLNLVRVQLAADGTRARVVLADSRKLRLPERGVILRVEATGEGSIRVTDALAAGDGPTAVEVDLR